METVKNIDKKIRAILNFVKEQNNFVLTTHLNSDGDAIASVLAFGMFLDKLNKDYSIIIHDQEIDYKYCFLNNADSIVHYNPELKSKINSHNNPLIIFDAPGLKRIGDVAQLIGSATKILKIDHHPAEDTFSDLDWVDTTSSSVAAMVYEIIETSKVPFDQSIAEAIYTGIIYDTGRLSFSNTRSRDLEICARLIKEGAQPSTITNELYFSNNVNALKVIGRGLKSIRQFKDNKITVITLFNEDMDDVNQGEIEILANYSVSVNGTEAGVFIREIEKEKFKLSLRSKRIVDVSMVAAELHGGGHKRASGCRYEGRYEDLVQKVVDLISKQL